MQTKELEPCPFCGGEARVDRQGSGWATVRCAAGGQSCGAQPHVHGRETAVITAWNTRLPTSSGGRGEAWRPDREAVEQILLLSVISASVDVPEKFSERVAMRERIAANTTDVLLALPASPSQERSGELGSVGLQASPVSPSPSLADEAATPSEGAQCGACTHWQAQDTYRDTVPFGRCARIIHSTSICDGAAEPLRAGDYNWEEFEQAEASALNAAKAFCVDGSGYHAALYTARDFGCSLFAAAPEGCAIKPTTDGEVRDGEAAERPNPKTTQVQNPENVQGEA